MHGGGGKEKKRGIRIGALCGTYGRVEGRLVGADCREVGGHALGIRGGVHGQGRDAGQPLVAKQVVLARAHGLSGDRIGEYRPAGVATPGRRRGGRCGGGRADRGYGRGRWAAAGGRRGSCGRRWRRRRAATVVVADGSGGGGGGGCGRRWLRRDGRVSSAGGGRRPLLEQRRRTRRRRRGCARRRR